MTRFLSIAVGFTMSRPFSFILICLLFFAGCDRKQDASVPSASWVDSAFSLLDDESKFGQTLCLTVDPVGYFLNNDYKAKIQGFLRRWHPGAIRFETQFSKYTRDNLEEFSGVKLRRVVMDLESLSDIPLLFAADFETGAWKWEARATRFPPTLAFGATGSTAWAFRAGKITAMEAFAQGINLILGPVTDTSSTDRSQVFNFRCFGSEPDSAAGFVAAFVKGTQGSGTGTCLLRLSPVTDAGSIRTTPLTEGIAAGANSVLAPPVSYSRIGEEPPVPFKNWIKEQCGFQGLVIRMFEGDDASFAPRENSAAVLFPTYADGQDMIVLPDNPDVVGPFVDNLFTLIRLNKTKTDMLDPSAKSVLSLKESLHLHMVSQELDETMPGLGIREYRQTATDITKASITVLRNDNDIVPLDSRMRVILFVDFSDSVSISDVAEFSGDLENNHPDFMQVNVLLGTDAPRAREALKRAAEADAVVCLFFFEPSSIPGKTGLSPEQIALVRSLQAANHRCIGISFAGPDLIRDLPTIPAFFGTFERSTVDTQSVFDVLFGRAPAAGKLPMTLSDRYPAGAGMALGVGR